MNQDSQPPQEQEEEYQQVSVVSFFSEEEEEPETIFNFQHPHNTRSRGKPSWDPPPSTLVPNKGKNLPQNDIVIPELEYNMAEYLKRVKANISLFDLLKTPSIRDSLPKSRIIKHPRETQNNNLDSYAKPNNQKPRSKGMPPFFLTFDIFNRIVNNSMIDPGASSNFVPLSVCQKLNETWEPLPIQIVQLDRSKFKAVGRLRNVLLRFFADPRIHQTIYIVIANIPENYGM